MPFHRPRTLEDALALVGEQPGRFLAGGTDFFPALAGKTFHEPIIDLGRVSGLSGITRKDGMWRFGATTTWTQIVGADLPPQFDCLCQAARKVGSIQIQNAGTIAGNLCNASPAADGVPPLLALDAKVEITGRAGARTVPLDRFITGVRKVDLECGEIVTAVLVPDLQGVRSAFSKLGARRYLVISIAMDAAVVELEEDGTIRRCAVAVGACSAVATRLPAVESCVVGLPAEVALLRAHLAGADLSALKPIDDVRAPAAYRLGAARELICRTIVAAANGGG